MSRPRLEKKSEAKPQRIDAGRALHVLYRPEKLSQVAGHDAVIESLTAVLDGRSVPHTYLFTGPSGVGKTTLARILGNELEVGDVREVDAASWGRIEDMRQLMSEMQYEALGDNPRRLLIIDECHSISKPAWQALLKMTEEPPDHLYWVFCTTEEEKVPLTLKTRAQCYQLQPVPFRDLSELVADIVEAESFDTPEEVIEAICLRAKGSPRQALTNLSVARACKTREAALELIERQEKGETIDLCRALCDIRRCGDWRAMIKLTKDAIESGDSPETIRYAVLNYAARVLVGHPDQPPTTDMKRAVHLLFVLEQFAEPFRVGENAAPLLVAVGRVVVSADPPEKETRRAQ